MLYRYHINIRRCQTQEVNFVVEAPLPSDDEIKKIAVAYAKDDGWKHEDYERCSLRREEVKDET